jgi:hypothetical protein
VFSNAGAGSRLNELAHPALTYSLEQVRLGKIQRLIVNMPPRSLNHHQFRGFSGIPKAIIRPAYRCNQLWR